MHRLSSFLLCLGLALDYSHLACAQQSWPEHRGDMRGVSSGAPAGSGPIDVQTFTAGAGTYTWTKPTGKLVTLVILYGAGCGGGSGGFGAANSSGGGAGAGAHVVSNTFATASLGATESVILGAGGAGGAGVTVAGVGNNGGQGGETSFGTVGENLVRLRMDSTNCVGQGGAANVGNAGLSTLGAGSTFVFTMINFASNGGGGGSKTTGGNTFQQISFHMDGFNLYPSVSGAGGGGTNAGAAFQKGGNTAVSVIGNITNVNQGLQTDYPVVLGGQTDAAPGVAGFNGGFNIQLAVTKMAIAAGQGGTGGAGSILTTAGAGGVGGNCGGGGGGGGSSTVTASGAGGAGGPGCVFVFSY